VKNLRRAKLSFTFSSFEASVIVAGLIVHIDTAGPSVSILLMQRGRVNAV
jgi:hypothetical protein